MKNLNLVGAYTDGFYFHLKLGIVLTNLVRKSDEVSAVIRTAKSTVWTSWLWKVGAGEVLWDYRKAAWRQFWGKAEGVWPIILTFLSIPIRCTRQDKAK